jgi:hypothetical protein
LKISSNQSFSLIQQQTAAFRLSVTALPQLFDPMVRRMLAISLELKVVWVRIKIPYIKVFEF